MVAPTVVGTPTTFASATSGSTIVLDKPVGVQNGDMLVAVLRTNGSTSAADFALAGWTRRGYTFKPNDGAGRVFGIYTHSVTDATTEPATYTFSKAVADARRVGALFIVRGVDITNPVAGNSVGWDATATPRVQLNSFPLDTTDAALLVYAWAVEIVSPNAATPTVAPSAAVALVPSATGTSTTRTTIWVGSEPISGSAATGARSLTWASATGEAASGVVLRGLAVAASAKPGFSSVSQMLATEGATWAHRGGSANWPEMSEYAYDQAVAAGYGALEFSANRTSDGVWVGSHDASLNRTSQTTGLPDISTMTWAQVQNYQNTLNSAGTPRPYYRLDAFLDKYTPTHVVIVDPKFDVGRVTEFLNLLDAHGGPSKIVVKFFGVGTGAGALADAATARGYQTWGYFYEADHADGDLAAWQSRWSILGMSFDASQAAWDAVVSYGKPVVGHIAGSQADYDMARQKGARIVQTAAVATVRPVSSWNAPLVLPTLAASGAGTHALPGSSGTASATLPQLALAATGVSAKPVFHGTGDANLVGLTAAAAGTTTVPVYSGAGALALSSMQAVGLGDGVPPVYVGSATLGLPALGASGAGRVENPHGATGAGSLIVAALTAHGDGKPTAPEAVGIGALAVAALQASGGGSTTAPGSAGHGELVLSGLLVTGTDHKLAIIPDKRTLAEEPITRTLTPITVNRTLEDA